MILGEMLLILQFLVNRVGYFCLWYFSMKYIPYFILLHHYSFKSKLGWEYISYLPKGGGISKTLTYYSARYWCFILQIGLYISTILALWCLLCKRQPLRFEDYGNMVTSSIFQLGKLLEGLFGIRMRTGDQ